MRKLVLTLAVLSLALAAVPSHAAAQTEIAPPGAAITGFAAPVVVAVKGQPLEFVNTDPTTGHNVVSVAIGPNTKPWCSKFARNQCPLFATGLPSDAGVPVTADLSGTTVGQTYAFVCSLHPTTMKGSLMIVA